MNILDTIIEHKKGEVRDRKQRIPRSALADHEWFDRPTVSLLDSIARQRRVGIIAEIKRRSPSAGPLRSDVVLSEIAEDYASHGATAISVLTDEQFFSGSLDDLAEVRRAVPLPLLRKDFIIDEYQVFEAKAYGAHAILLIAAVLDRSHLLELHAAATELALECLVELYEVSEIDILDFDRMKLIGINNRDLRTLEVNIQQSFTIAQHLPKEITLVSESGIRSSEDLVRLHKAGFHAALVGEHFMKSKHPGKTLQQMLEGMTNAPAC